MAEAKLLGAVGIADLSGEPVHVRVVGETDQHRLLVQPVGRDVPAVVIERRRFVSELSVAPAPLSDEVRRAALDLSQAIERAKAMAGTDHLLDQEDYRIIHDELDETDQYPFAAALIEHGVHVRTGRVAIVDVVTDPHGEVDGLARHPEPWASPGGAGEARGRGEDPQDAPAGYPWSPADSGDGISNEEAHTELEFPWPRKVEGQAGGWDDVLLAQIDKAIEEGGGWANMKRLPGGEDAIWDLIERDILLEEDGFVRRRQPSDPPRKRYDPEEEEGHEAEMGWSGTELVDERWAEIVASVSMTDLVRNPHSRPKHDLEKDSDANTPSGRDRSLNPSIHEEIGEAYGSNNQFEDPDLHLGRSMRDIIAMEGQPYQTNVPIAEGEGEGVHDEPDLDEVVIQPHASIEHLCRHGRDDPFCPACVRGARHAQQLDQDIGIAGDAYEDPGAGEPLDAHDEDATPDPKDFGVMVGRSMRELIGQAVDNRMSDPDVQTNVDEQQNDRAIARPPDDEPVRYAR